MNRATGAGSGERSTAEKGRRMTTPKKITVRARSSLRLEGSGDFVKWCARLRSLFSRQQSTKQKTASALTEKPTAVRTAKERFLYSEPRVSCQMAVKIECR
jgi:hypothetical protein